MITVRVRSKLKTSGESVVFTNTVGKNSRYFVDIFNKAIIPLTPFANHVEEKVEKHLRLFIGSGTRISVLLRRRY